MNIHAIISITSALLSLAVGVSVLTLNPRSQLHRLFFLFSLSVVYLGLTEFGYRESGDLATAVTWLRLSLLAPLVPALLLSFALVYSTTRKIWANPFVNTVIYGPAILFIAVDFLTSRLSGTPVRTSWGWSNIVTERGWSYLYWLWLTVMLMAQSIACFIHYFHEHNIQKRRQARLVAVAFLVPAILGIISDVIYPFANIQYVELTTLGFTIANILIAYSIVRHRLFVLSPAAATDRIIAAMSDGLLLVDENRTVAFANEAVAGMTGGSIDRVVGRSFASFFEDSRAAEVVLERLILENGIARDIAAQMRTMSGTVLPVSLSIAAMHTKERTLQGMVVIARDMTERVGILDELQHARDELEERVVRRTQQLAEANARIAQEKDQLEITLKSIGDGVITTDAAGNIVMLNVQAETITGWELNDARGRALHEVLMIEPQDGQAQPPDLIQSVLKTGRPLELPLNTVLLSRDGARKNIADSAAPILAATGEISGIVIVLRDVTEKLMIEDELFRMKKLESVGVLAGGIAHDFNNMLAAIIAHLFMVKVSLGSNETAQKLINDAESAALRAQRLTQKLLTFSKGGEPVKQRVSVRSLIDETVGFVLSGSACDYALDYGEDLAEINADKGQLDQVLSNLILNAEQAMPDGGTIAIMAENVVVGATVPVADQSENRIAELVPGNYVKVSVGDSGVGIPGHLVDKVFDPFFSTKETGCGLGLSIVYSIVNKHGGGVTVSSKIGEGTVFTLYLPAVSSAKKDASAEKRTSHREEQSLPSRILLMDDEVMVMTVIAKVLERFGHTVVTAQNGEEALRAYSIAMESGDGFDLVILDLTVQGGMGGKHCLEQLKKIDPAVVAVVSSGYSNDPVMSNYEEYGFAGMIAKPYSIEELAEEIQRCLRVSHDS